MWIIIGLVVAYFIVGGMIISLIDFLSGSAGDMGTLNWIFWPITLIIWIVSNVFTGLFMFAWIVAEVCGEGFKRMLQRYKDGEG